MLGQIARGTQIRREISWHLAWQHLGKVTCKRKKEVTLGINHKLIVASLLASGWTRRLIQYCSSSVRGSSLLCLWGDAVLFSLQTYFSIRHKYVFQYLRNSTKSSFIFLLLHLPLKIGQRWSTKQLYELLLLLGVWKSSESFSYGSAAASFLVKHIDVLHPSWTGIHCAALNYSCTVPKSDTAPVYTEPCFKHSYLTLLASRGTSP